MTWALSLASLLVSVGIMPWFYRVDGEPRWLMLSLLIPVMWAMSKSKVGWPAALLFLWASLSLLWTPIIWDGIDGWWKLALCCGIFCLATEVEKPKWIYLLFAMGVSLSGVEAILQLNDITFHFHGLTFFPQSGMPGGLFVNRNFMAEAAVIAVILALGYRWFLLVPFLLICVYQSRMAIAAVGACAIAWIWRRSRILAVAVCLVCSVFGWALFQERDMGSVTERFGIWADTIDGMTLEGNGIGSFYAYWPLHASRINSAQNRPEHAHNDALEFAYELGLPGVVLVASIAVMGFFGRGDEREKLALLSVAVLSMGGFPLYNAATAFMAWFIAGRLYRDRSHVFDAWLRRLPEGNIAAFLANIGRWFLRPVGKDRRLVSDAPSYEAHPR